MVAARMPDSLEALDLLLPSTATYQVGPLVTIFQVTGVPLSLKFSAAKLKE